MPDDLDKIAAAAAENKQMPAMRIALQRLLHKQRHPRKAAAHIGAAGSEPDPDPAIIEFIRLVKPFKTK